MGIAVQVSTFEKVYSNEGLAAFGKGMNPAIVRGVVYGGMGVLSQGGCVALGCPEPLSLGGRQLLGCSFVAGVALCTVVGWSVLHYLARTPSPLPPYQNQDYS